MKCRDKQPRRLGWILPPGLPCSKRCCRNVLSLFLKFAVFILLCTCAAPKSQTTMDNDAPQAPSSGEHELMAHPTDNEHDDQGNSYYYYLEAYIRLNSQELDRAVFYLKKAIGRDPESHFLKRELALVLLRQKKEREALAVIEKLIESDPNDIEALILFARIKEGLREIETARETYERIIANDPNRENIHLLLGDIYLQKEDWVNAERVYKNYLQHFPASYAGHFFLGKVFLSQQRLDHAREQFTKVLELEPKLVEARFEMIALMELEGEFEAAERLYQEKLASEPDNIRAALGYGILCQKLGRMDAAQQIFQRLGARAEKEPAVITLLARHYLEMESYDAVINAIKAMLGGADDFSDLYYILGLAYDGKKQFAESMQSLEKVDTESRFYENAVIQLAFIYQENGQISLAVDRLKFAIESRPQNAEFRLYLGSFYEEMEEYNSAVNTLREGLHISPDNVRLLFRLGVVCDKAGRKEESIETMIKVIDIDPDHANALNYLGYTYADAGRRLDEAESLIKRALEIKPDDGYITDSLGWVYYKKGNYEEALNWLIKAATLVPDDPVILEHVGDVYQKLGQVENALEYYNRAIDKKTDSVEDLEKKIRNLREGNQQGFRWTHQFIASDFDEKTWVVMD